MTKESKINTDYNVWIESAKIKTNLYNSYKCIVYWSLGGRQVMLYSIKIL